MTDVQADTEQPRSPWRWLLWLFAALGILGAAAAIWLAVVINSSFRQRQPAEVAANKPGEVFEIGDIRALNGTPWIAINIYKADEQSGGSFSKSYSDRDQRNILLLERSTGKTTPILPDNSKNVTEADYLPAKGVAGATSEDAAMAAAEAAAEAASGRAHDDLPAAYYVIQISEYGKHLGQASLLVGTLATRKQKIVMEHISGVDEMWMVDANRLALIVRENKALYYRVVDIPALKLLVSRKIEID